MNSASRERIEPSESSQRAERLRPSQRVEPASVPSRFSHLLSFSHPVRICTYPFHLVTTAVIAGQFPSSQQEMYVGLWLAFSAATIFVCLSSSDCVEARGYRQRACSARLAGSTRCFDSLGSTRWLDLRDRLGGSARWLDSLARLADSAARLAGSTRWLDSLGWGGLDSAGSTWRASSRHLRRPHVAHRQRY